MMINISKEDIIGKVHYTYTGGVLQRGLMIKFCDNETLGVEKIYNKLI